MANKREPFLPDSLYHVYNHGNGDENIFRSEGNYEYFLMKFNQYISPIADTFAYCLMPNHFHFALCIKEESKLTEHFKDKLTKNPQGFENLAGLISRKFSNFLNAYAKAFNKMFERKGSLFLDNIQRKKIENENYFTHLIHYIHYNPVHHGFVRDLDDWKYSSYHAFLSEKKTKVERENVLQWFGGKDDFEKFHQWKPKVDFEIEL
jgi:REP element-mobilizing transposase RayT